MSELIKIKFDASIHEDCVGIGIHNFDMKTDIIHRVKLKNKPCSLIAENMALIKTIHYMRQVGIKSAHLFTDNKTLAEKGIQKSLLKGFGCVTLTWIPREFNEEADALSKEAHKLQPKYYDVEIDKITVSNGTKTPKKAEAKAKAEAIKGLNKRLRAFTPEQRIKMLKKVRQSKFTTSFIDVMEGNSKTIDQQVYRKDDRPFLSIAMAAFNTNELPSCTNWKHLIKKTSMKVPNNQHLSTLLKENVA